MQIRYRVHSVDGTTVYREVPLQDGRTALGGFGGIVVEMVPVDGGKTLTLDLVPDDRPAELERFAVGNIIVVTFDLETA